MMQPSQRHIPGKPGSCGSTWPGAPTYVRAIANLQRACAHWLPGRYHIEIIDLVENPHMAVEDQILAVPTLVKKHPPPIRKMVGDLSDTERLLFRLQL